MQNDDASTHLPFVHSPEQQVVGAAPSADVELAVQGFPAVRQVALSGWQCPPVQLWLQHSDAVVHAWLSATQLVALAQRWLVVSHWRLQQSVATWHELPGPPQVVTPVPPVPPVPVVPVPPVPVVPESPLLFAPLCEQAASSSATPSSNWIRFFMSTSA
jgi:hypothetical protein